MMDFKQSMTSVNKSQFAIVSERNFSDIDISNCNLSDRILKLSDWHKKLAHQNKQQIKRYLRRENIEFEDDSSDFCCESCLSGKQQRQPFPPSQSRAKTCLEIIHADLAGPMETKSLGGNRYVLVLKDDYSGYRSVYFLRNKSAFEVRHC